MTLTFPRDLRMRLYLGRWVDVTELSEARSLRQGDPVTVQWGAQSEQLGKVPPSTAEGVLNNTGGHWTPDNPMSDYWAYLRGRNVPAELALRVSRDTYSRTVPSGWGFSDTGDGWNSVLGSGSQSVGSGVGVHVVAVANFSELTFLGDSYANCRVAASVTVALNDVTGGSIEPLNLVQRYQPSGTFAGEHYMLRVVVTTAEAVTVAILHNTLGTLAGPVTVPGLADAVSAKTLRAAFQVEGQTLRGKVWKSGTDEPLGWQITAHHERLTGGFPGIRSGVASGNTNVPVSFEYDDWECQLVLHSGELSKLQPTWDESHKIKKAKFKLADISQRLGRPERAALSSAPRRYLASNPSFTATDHWPLDEGPTAPAQGLNAVAGGSPARFFRETGVIPNRGEVEWGETDQVHTAVPGFAMLANGGRFVMTTNQAPLTSSWSVMWAMRVSPDAGAEVLLSTAATTNRFVLTFDTDASYELVGNPSGANLGGGGVFPAGVGTWVTFGLTTFDAGGGSVGFHINVDGQALGIGSYATDGGYSPLREIVAHVPQPTTGGQGASAFSTMFVTPTRFDTADNGLPIGYRAHWAIMGWRGEPGGVRASRLAVEEGVPFDYYGDLGGTRAMGSQRPLPLLDQFQECADADGAVLFAPRYTPGVALRTRRSVAGRRAVATLSYAAGQVAPGLASSADDRLTVNLVRAERINGGTLVIDTPSGPMNTRDPGTDPEAIGKVPGDARANVQGDAQLGDLGGWVRALGTIPEMRFPRVTVDLRAAELNTIGGLAVARSLLGLTVGDRLLITGMTAADVYRDLDQVVRGGTETFGNVRRHRIVLNTAPYEKYRAGPYGDANSRYDGAVATFDSSLTTSTTGARNITVSSGPLWTTNVAMYPLDVLCEGERITVSGVTGAGPGQVMTISARSVNGVVKAHAAGAPIELFGPVYYC